VSNLIITIISIALVAITALLAVVVISPAIAEYRASTIAERITDGVKQVGAAGAIWRVEKGVSNICASIDGWAYANGLCTSDGRAFQFGWNEATLDKGKYVYPFLFLPGELPKSNNSATTNFPINPNNPMILDGVTYGVRMAFFHDSKGDAIGISFYVSDNSGIFDSTMTMVKVCQKINKNNPPPAGTTIDGTLNLPGPFNVTMYGDGWDNNVTNNIPPGTCFLKAGGFGTTNNALSVYYRV
jgi:hypothetical protein